MDESLEMMAGRMTPGLVALRRDLHRHPESFWTEYRTTALVASRLRELGYEVLLGERALDPALRSELPDEEAQEEAWARAAAEAAEAGLSLPEECRGGLTGVVGVLRRGDGPTAALRVDIDALKVAEADGPGHRPAREGFASVHPGLCHACGHDVHTALGLGVAEAMAARSDWSGTLKLLFQPGEEGMLGALPMTARGHLDDVDYFLGVHVGIKATRTGQLAAGCHDFLATSKLDVAFTGTPAHAGICPQEGRSALLAAATACVQLHAIPRHGDGASRVNVGFLEGGGARNVVPGRATMKLETRGVTTGINQYMDACAHRILEAAAAMHGVEVQIETTGCAEGSYSDPALIEAVQRAAAATPGIDEVLGSLPFGACEDVTHMMNRVRAHGGLATFLLLGSDLAAVHHSGEFDVDEKCLPLGLQVLCRTLLGLMQK